MKFVGGPESRDAALKAQNRNARWMGAGRRSALTGKGVAKEAPPTILVRSMPNSVKRLPEVRFRNCFIECCALVTAT